MRKEFSTFDIVKLTGINRNTFQSALAAGFIEMDIKRAEGKSERSLSSLDEVYRIATFFQMVRCGIPRKKAWQAYNEVNLEWSNVGFQPGQYRYLIRMEIDPGHPNLLASWQWKLLDRMPRENLGQDAKFCWIIHVAAIKKQVDDAIGNL